MRIPHPRPFVLLALSALAGTIAACGKPTSPSEMTRPPAISAQPQSQTVPYAGSATLTVAGSGTSSLTWQWYVGDRGDTASPVSGATAGSYMTPALTETSRFWVRLQDAGGSVDSATATVTVEAPTASDGPPTILEPPEDETIAAGQTATLFVEVSGTAPFTFQWHEDSSTGESTSIEGAVDSSFVTPPLSTTSFYWVRVSNALGSSDSALATVTVGATGPPPPPPPTGPPPPPPPPPPGPPGPPGPPPPSLDPVILNEDFGRLFPSSNWWNQDISGAPVDPNSDAYISFIGGSRSLHPDFGPPPYGIPYAGVGGSQPRVPIDFVLYGGESDAGIGGVTGYPLPDEAKTQPNFIEGGAPGGGNSGDRHFIVVDRDQWLLFELYATHWNPGSGRWEAGSGAIFDLSSDARRPDGWTSADAAGLAVLPGLVKYDEVVSGAINHAFRVTVRSTDGYVWPASHAAGGTSGALPMGARLRLKASVDISGYPPDVQAIFQAMKTYGLIVADNGSDMYITGTMDTRWNNGVLNPAFGSLSASDFEVIQLGWR